MQAYEVLVVFCDEDYCQHTVWGYNENDVVMSINIVYRGSTIQSIIFGTREPKGIHNNVVY